jgi:hypothetical protein
MSPNPEGSAHSRQSGKFRTHPRLKCRLHPLNLDEAVTHWRSILLIPWSRKLFAIIALSVVLLSIVLTLYNLKGPPGSSDRPSHWLSFSNPQLQGGPHKNTTRIWIAVIANVSSKQPFSSYRAGLILDAHSIVEPVSLHPGVLATVGNLSFEFFDSGVGCYPLACPPPDGPDGLLGSQDYFRLNQVASGATYVIRVFWAETGEVAGEIAVTT